MSLNKTHWLNDIKHNIASQFGRNDITTFKQNQILKYFFKYCTFCAVHISWTTQKITVASSEMQWHYRIQTKSNIKTFLLTLKFQQKNVLHQNVVVHFSFVTKLCCEQKITVTVVAKHVEMHDRFSVELYTEVSNSMII